jgi:tight adherence protein B
MISAIAIQRTSGGDLSRALRTLSEQLSERERLTREVRGATAQARLTGALVACLPVVAGVGLEVARPGLLVGLLSGPALALVTTSLIMQAVGILLIRRIARVDV